MDSLKTRQSGGADTGLPNANELAALRAWFEGIDARDAVVRYLGHAKATGQSSRGILSQIRRRLAVHARKVGRSDLANIFEKTGPHRTERARAVAGAMTALETAPRYPHLGDDVSQWLPARLRGC